MSKTPRTDEQILHHNNGNWHPSAFVLTSFARQLETELADKDRRLAEARAEIERLKQLWSCNRARLAVLERAHDSTIEEQASLCAEGQSITELVAAKDKLIEQMREALKVARITPGSAISEQLIKAALEAVEGS